MRTAIAAGFAALIVAAVAFASWRALDARLNEAAPSPERPVDALVEALSEGPDGDVSSAVRSGGDELEAAVESVASGLPEAGWDVDRGPITIDDAVATTTLTVTLTTEEFGEVTWRSSIEATRVRGQWGVDVTRQTLHPDLGEGRRVAVVRDDVTRASLMTHDGEALTSHGSAQTIGVAPAQVVNEDRLLSTWEAVLPETLGDLQELLEADVPQDWFHPLVTLSESRFEDAWSRLRAVPGVIARDADDATPTDDAFATHVLGRVGQPTAEQAEELGVAPDQVVGLRGLERVFEDQLVGSERARLLIVDGDGDEIVELAAAQSDPSGPVTTTLDAVVQEAVENALVGVETPTGVVVVDTATSAVRAAASRPLSGYHRAFEGNYPPGDVMAPILLDALSASGVGVEDPATCPREDTVAGAALSAPVGLGDTTVVQALAAGCDTAAAALAAQHLQPAGLVAAAERFGFGVEPDLPLPAATASLPQPIDTTELARAGAGRARVLASPLHVATVVAAAVEGTWHAPHLVVDVEADRPSAELAAPAAAMQRLFEAGAGEAGSATALGAAGGQGLVGTAPVTGDDVEHAWAVGTVDGLAFAVLVESTGGDTAPAERVAERFLREFAALTD